ncbi:hypothetical protein COS83_03815 [archaeon CG07_land_8_20_14_0_80_38_8]|nr:MAG: hypothetical protein COS83_03815 [archaeon CG07_land_8_20_14_0_80_38_8]PIU88923.1 MAG: hypothetical protein COS64_02015 [archaeon CG06_land_8_20_14_3_00_37_11]
MILFLGLLDLASVFFSLATIYTKSFAGFSIIFLTLLGLKGLWTLLISRDVLFTGLGLLDLMASILTIISITYGLFAGISQFLLVIIGVKSLVSIVKM